MNIASVIRTALLGANVVKQDGTSPALLTQSLLLQWANDCQRKLEAHWRRSGKDWNLVVRESDDTSFSFEGETYNPTSFALSSDVLSYTLPPDFISMKRIRAITTAFREYVFTNLDVTNPVFRALENVDNPGGSELYWDITGRRTLRLSHTTQTACDLEIMYNARLPKLRIYTDVTGACAVSIDSTAVTAATASFVDEALSTPMDLILNSTGAATSPVVVGTSSSADYVDPAATRGPMARHYPITSFDTDTTLTLAQNYLLSTDTSIGYIVASAPIYLDDHWPIMVSYLIYQIKKKIGDMTGAQVAKTGFREEVEDFKFDTTKRVDEAEFVEDYNG